MHLFIKCSCFFFLLFSANAQSSIDQALDWYNNESVPYISVTELQNLKNQIILDTREWEEYEVSHLKNAVWVGYDDFKLADVVTKYPDKNLKYCGLLFHRGQI